MSIVSVGGLTKYYGAELIFADVSFQVARGDKVALVGVNGAGKSTLLKIIAGLESPTRGGVHIARGTRVSVLAQEAQFTSGRTLWEEMQVALEHLNNMRDEIAALEHALADTAAPEWEERMARYGELLHRFEHAGGYDVERRTRMILDGLGFTGEQYAQPVAQFSGGQKTRAALAAALLSDPDLLLLDEPTNHLDLAALEWLERFLRDWEGTLIVVSHDRYFLDKVTNRTLEIAFSRLDGDYPASYNRYLELKAARLELQLKQYQAQQEMIARTEEFIRRFKNSQLSRQARGRERRLERLKEGWEGGSGKTLSLIDRPEQQKKLALSIGTQIRGGDLVLKLENLVVGFAGGADQRPATRRQAGDDSTDDARSSFVVRRASHGDTELLHVPDLEIWRGQRVALMGPNGSGKTTLLRTIVGELPPLRGRVRLGHRIAITYYAQAHEGLLLHNTVIEEIRRIRPTIKETEARTLLGRFLFSGDDVFKRVRDLSGGERSRVALAQLTLMGGNLLVLDEPTNHLDIGAREALESVLNEYNGTILFVSHDRYFVDAVADTIWMVQDGGVTAFDGTYSEFAAARERDDRRPAADDRRPATGDQKPTAGKSQPQSSKTSQPRSTQHADREATREERRRQRKIAALEEEIAMLEGELKQLEADIAAAASDGKRVASLSIQYAEVQEMLQTRYDEWAAAAG
ncbi:MAG TPA: ABC-F family ATP-binding cassette domain-containing protein [Roseiflexaceae bacterium]|nr:ABC-F family ATP-binding cassette domain-containing protein [Roseiflexaceae bacterium]